MATLYSWQLTFCAITRSLYLMWQKLSCSVFSLKCPVCCVTRDTSSQYAGQSSVQMSTIFYSKSLYQIETETNLMKLYQMGPGGNNPILLLTSIALQTFPSLSLSGRAKHFFHELRTKKSWQFGCVNIWRDKSFGLASSFYSDTKHVFTGVKTDMWVFTFVIRGTM